MKPCCPGPPGILVKATGSGHLWDSRTPVAVGHTGETLHLGSSASEQEMSRQPLTYSDESDSPGHTSDRFLLFSAFNFLSRFLFLKSVSSFASRGSVAGASFTAVRPFGGLCRDHVGCGEALGGRSRAERSPGSCSHQNLAGLLHLLASQAPLCRAMGAALP